MGGVGHGRGFRVYQVKRFSLVSIEQVQFSNLVKLNL